MLAIFEDQPPPNGDFRTARANRDACPARSAPYQRWRHLPRLIRIEFGEIDDRSIACALSLLARIDAAIARERRRARARHWAYDANRHIALIEARRGEMRAIRQAVSAATERLHNRARDPARAQASSLTGASSAGTSVKTRALETGTKLS